MTREEPDDLCVHCRRRVATERDHIPPACLFPKPRPSNLITVPTCEQCNRGASKDDEYFRATLTMRRDVFGNSVAAENWESILRGMERDRHSGLKRKIASTARYAWERTAAGILARRVGVFDVDRSRTMDVVKRITTGLFYHEAGRALPRDYAVDLYLFDGTEREDPPELPAIWNALAKNTLSGERHEFGQRVFTYRASFAPDDDNVMYVAMGFYGKVFASAVTLPPRATDQSE